MERIETTSRLHKEIDSLKKSILRFVAEVEENVRMSVTALKNKDADLAQEVIIRDARIDSTEVQIEEDCLKILALYQPVANDLRYIVAAMKINVELERISDLAVNIAERAIFLSAQPPFTIPFDFNLMAKKVQHMLKTSIDALVALSASEAYEVCALDEEVDNMNREMYLIVEDMTHKAPERIKELLHYLGIYLPGYQVSFAGALVGAAYVFILGWLAGRAIGAIYNVTVARAEG